jgi:peptide deformylase
MRYDGDPVLRKVSRPIDTVTDRIRILAKDMIETMRAEQGVGLAAPQIGILRRLFVVEIEEIGLHVMINPEIIEQNGEQTDYEGCLSVPGKSGKVKRPDYVKVQYMDLEGNDQILEAEGFFARAICHENDHLNGILYIDKVEEELLEVQE